MKLNHDIYEEAMANVELPEETGMRLLHESSHRKMQRRQKQKLRAAAAAAAIVTKNISFNGICYARTGQNAIEMFVSLFQQANMEEISTLAQETRESGESFTHENLKFTLERYWYDKENTQAFFTIRTESLNGLPLDVEDIKETYVILPTAEFASCSNANSELSADKTSLLEYYTTQNAYDNLGTSVNEMQIRIRKYQQDIGFFTLAPTGQAKTRYADFGRLKAKNTWAKITGAGLTFSLDYAVTKDKKPFEILDIVMKDGVIYRSDNSNHLPYTAEAIEEMEKENIRLCTHDIFSNSYRDKTWTNYSVSFCDYIEVDDITAIYADGNELMLR